MALDDGEGVQHDCNISVESRTNAGVSNGHADTHSASRALAAVNAQLAEATAFRDAAQQAHDRLAKPAALLDEAAREYTGEKARHDAAITTWYEGGCPGERPELPSRMIERLSGSLAICGGTLAPSVSMLLEPLARRYMRQTRSWLHYTSGSVPRCTAPP